MLTKLLTLAVTWRLFCPAAKNRQKLITLAVSYTEGFGFSEKCTDREIANVCICQSDHETALYEISVGKILAGPKTLCRTAMIQIMWTVSSNCNGKQFD